MNRATTFAGSAAIRHAALASTLLIGIVMPAMASNADDIDPGAPAPPDYAGLGDYVYTGRLDSHLVDVPNGWVNHGVQGHLTRYYFVYVPASYTGTKKVPLVVLLHGGGDNFTSPLKPPCHLLPIGSPAMVHCSTEADGFPSSVWATASQNPVLYQQDPGNPAVQSLADQYGFLVAVPNGTNPALPNLDPLGGSSADPNNKQQVWNDCSGNYQGYSSNGQLVATPNDVNFIVKMIDKMKRATTNNGGDGYLINTNKIYVTGVSNGGDMAHRLAREFGQVAGGMDIAAAAVGLGGDGATIDPQNGKLQLQDTCTSTVNTQSNPVPLWMIKGTEDYYTRYLGGASIVNAAALYIPYETSLAGYPLRINLNTPTDGNATLLSQMLHRYSLSGTTPATTYVTSTVTNDGALGADSKIACDQYGGSTRSQINNCVATRAGHIEPSFAVPAGSINRTIAGAQNLDIDTATYEWNFFRQFTAP